MTVGVTVRRAELSDLGSIVSLRLALLREYGDNPLYARLRPDVEARAYELCHTQILSPLEVIFVAEAHGDSEAEAIGLLRCADTPSSPLLYPERYCYVSSVYVRPPWRRQGVLRALMAQAIDWCKDRGIEDIRLHNAASSVAAREAWKALGFEVVEQVRRWSVRDGPPSPSPSSSPSASQIRTAAALFHAETR